MRIVLAEDSGLIRESLVGLIGQLGHEVVAAVDNVDAMTAAVHGYAPDLLVTDVRMPPRFSDEGLRAAVGLRARLDRLPIVVLSQYVETVYVAELLEAGDAGTGYLLKDRVSNGREFVAALEKVAAGGTLVDPEVVRRLVARRRDPLGRLSAREREVLELIAQGRSNTAIGRKLSLTDATVSKHIGAIFTKLSLDPSAADHRRVLAVLRYLRGGPTL
ncbi:response regulator transcription factor [Actinomadura sp. KC345]|uniref:LuxR C-terminal-related transcriptional regulator n=1 Tax=Actinomadura sp. KC345 TaxID=2530371 RepID=UPI001049D892|nr:response regulator transcription factor [Actinomadura sp. KC345]TDC58730.1 response regulator transcription factor [Actinomadura sp. KC345]